MLSGLFAAIAVAPLYWLIVPARWRREALALASLAAVTWAMRGSERSRRLALGSAAGLALVALFAWNKLAGDGLSVLPSQPGVVFLGVSFLVLKAAGAVIDGTRGTLRDARPREILAWLVFLPTYPSGPMETFDHFRAQAPHWEQRRALGGLERILFGLVKALVIAHYLGVWVDPILAAPAQSSAPLLLLALYALALRFYFDLAGYSDIAIGLSALYGYDIAENFDRPFAARNLALLWQRWHMTLTGWLRTYVFTTVTRALLRRSGGRRDHVAISAGLLATFLLIGVWHGLSWNFVLFGLLQAIAVIWVTVFARDVGRRLLPPGLIRWWRESPIGYALSVAVTFNYFAATTIFSMTGVMPALRFLRALAGG